MESKNNKSKALFCLVLCNTIWGVDYVIMEYLCGVFPPQFVNLMRTAIVAVMMWSIVLVKKDGFGIAKKDWPMIFLCGAFGSTIYGTMEGFSLKFVGSALCSLILATVPIMGMLADRVLYKKPITGKKVLAILISMLGVAMLVLLGEHDSLEAGAFGIILMFLTAAVWVVYILLLGPIQQKHDPLSGFAGMYVGGLVTCIPVGLTDLPQAGQFTAVSVGLLLLSACVNIAVGNFLYYYAVGNLSVTTVSAFENVLPVVTCIGAYIAFGELLTLGQILGGVIIMAATTWVSLQEGSGEEEEGES